MIREQLADDSLKNLVFCCGPRGKCGEWVTCMLFSSGWIACCVGNGLKLKMNICPLKFREALLNLAHSDLAEHMGVRKTSDCIMRNFWPRLAQIDPKYAAKSRVN